VSRSIGARAGLAAAVALVAVAAVAVAATRDWGGDGGAPAAGSRSDRWAPLRGAPLERTEVAAARIGRFVYVVGGFERRTGDTTAALERYDIRRNRWRRLRAMPLGLNHPTAVAYRGRLYVHGGYTGARDLTRPTARLLAYSPRRDRWRRLASAPTRRAAHAAAVVRGRLYVAGGRNDRGELRSLESYDFKRRRWRRGPPMPGPARDHTAGLAAGGFFYVLAGRDLGGPGNYRAVDRYDPRRGRWRRLPGMRKARGGIAAARVGRRIVVFGGEEADGTIAEVEAFDPRTRRWSRLPRMRTPRHGLGGVALGRRAFAIEGGPQPGFHFSNAIEFLDLR
jgi:N-acetylneuraminic acid mutarotase